MLRANSRVLLAFHQVIDLLFIGLAFGCAYYTKAHLLPASLIGLANSYDYQLGLLLTLLTCHFGLRFFGCYRRYRTQKLRNILSRIVKASITGAAGIVFLSYMLHMEGISRLLLAIFTIYNIAILTTSKAALYSLLNFHRKRDYNTRNILIIGSRQRAIDFIKAIKINRGSGYRILGCLETIDGKNAVGENVYKDVKIVGTLASFNVLLREVTVDEVVFGMPLRKIDDVHKYIYFAEMMGINVKILPDFQIDKIAYLPKTAHTSLFDFMGIPTLSLSSLPEKESELFVKNLIDYVGATFGLLLLSPIFAVISTIIKITSPGPVFFTQQRVGVNGRHFTIYKFRTMVQEAEALKASLAGFNESDGPVFKIRNDPRITSIGRFLRKSSLDELPQLLNVLRGEMSLVGPRPPVPQEVEEYELWQRRRLSMKPGLTCIWQVSGRNNIGFDDWMKLDLEYIDNWSLGLDMKLLLKTVREVLFGGGR